MPRDAVTVGKATYGMLNVLTNGINAHLTIENYCSIADNGTFALSAEHPLNTISTYPFKAKLMSQGAEALSKGDIIVEDDAGNGASTRFLQAEHADGAH